MDILIAATFLLLMLAIPMKYAGDMADAERTGYGWCLLALLVSLTLVRVAVEYAGHYAPAAAVVAVALTIATIMGTSMWRAGLIVLFLSLLTLLIAIAAQQYMGVDLAALVPEKVKPAVMFADL